MTPEYTVQYQECPACGKLAPLDHEDCGIGFYRCLCKRQFIVKIEPPKSETQNMTPTEQVSIVMDKYVEACSRIKELEAENAGLRERDKQLCKQLDRKREETIELAKAMQELNDAADKLGI